jgi:hypothetical protein
MLYGRIDDRIIELQSTIEEKEEEIHQLRKIIWKISNGKELTEEEKEIISEIMSEIQMIRKFQKGE